MVIFANSAACSAAVARNREPILAVLKRVLPAQGIVLEIASGTGEHAVHFAAGLPHLTWQPTDRDPGARQSIGEYRASARLPNLLAALELDASASSWPVARADAVVAINMIHIAPWTAAEGLMAGGVLPVIKHIPGHGRAMADSHFDLPVVRATREELEASDFVPFRRLAALPAAMTAHVVFTAYDADAPASISRRVTEDVIRGSIGFDGLLMSDDLAMKALAGSVVERAADVFAAGSDVVLACNGGLEETESVAAVAPPLAGRALGRFERARAVFRQQQPFEVAEAEACLAEVLHLTT